MKLTVQFKGFAEFDTMLKELGPRVANRVAARALRAAGRPIVQEARTLVPIKTGALRRAIRYRTRRSRNRTLKLASVGVFGKEGPLAHIIEFGTSAHDIRVTNKKVLADAVAGKFFGKEVAHPGVSERPFLRPAAENKAQEAFGRMADVLGDGIITEAKRR